MTSSGNSGLCSRRPRLPRNSTLGEMNKSFTLRPVRIPVSCYGWRVVWPLQILWTQRPTYHTDGLEVKNILSTFPAIDTNVDGVKISQGLENVAQVMDRGTLIRSLSNRTSVPSCTPVTSITGIRDMSPL